MNHEPTPGSSADRRPPPRDDTRDDTRTAGADPPEGESSESARQRSESSTRKAKAALARKLRFMTDLMNNLDMLVFAELSTLYYMDCSFFRLLIRATAQSVFLSPKSDDFLLLMPAHRPHVFAVFLPNILCILLHLFAALPQASEATRGYLHGGVMIDFIGQKAPSSKFSLLVVDLAIFAIQCFMIAVHTERERLRKIVHPLRRSDGGRTLDAGTGTEETTQTTQDHDAEERGVLRDGPSTGDETNDIEMQPLSSRDGQQTQEEGESSRLLSEASTQGAASPDLADVLRSGNAVLADFHVIEAIKKAGTDYQSAVGHSLRTIGYAATMARLAAERRARLDARQQPR